MERTALIAGASGLVGSFLLDLLLQDSDYSLVKILVRKPLDMQHSKLEQIVVNFDLLNPEQLHADDVFCCLGTTIKKAGSRDAFRKVDHDFPLSLARATRQSGATRFALVSAMGANAQSRIFYNRVKGEVEEKIRQVPFDVLCLMRPSLLLGPRQENRPGEEAAKVIMPLLGFLFPANLKAIHASQVAASMLHTLKTVTPGVHEIASGQMQKWLVKKRI